MSGSDRMPAAAKPVGRVCCRCKQRTYTAVLVRQVHSNSGPGWSQYACEECAKTIPPSPDPIEMLESYQRYRQETLGGPPPP